MTGREKPPPQVSDAGAAAALLRQERQAAALRANLGRRKAQAREREGQAGPDGARTKEPG
jgi:hypothetical protein